MGLAAGTASRAY